MKKIIFAAMLLGAGYLLFAQENVVYKMETTNSNIAYKVPEPIQVNFYTSYPEAVIIWEPRGEWWHATYKGDNRMNHIYYSSQPYYLEHPVNFKVTLPVINTYVPEGVITAAIDRYGEDLYSITMMKAATGEPVYQVCLLENGSLKNVWMNGENTVFTDINKVKTDNDQQKTEDK